MYCHCTTFTFGIYPNRELVPGLIPTRTNPEFTLTQNNIRLCPHLRPLRNVIGEMGKDRGLFAALF
jgi:hypothetical protein